MTTIGARRPEWFTEDLEALADTAARFAERECLPHDRALARAAPRRPRGLEQGRRRRAAVRQHPRRSTAAAVAISGTRWR